MKNLITLFPMNHQRTWYSQKNVLMIWVNFILRSIFKLSDHGLWASERLQRRFSLLNFNNMTNSLELSCAKLYFSMMVISVITAAHLHSCYVSEYAFFRFLFSSFSLNALKEIVFIVVYYDTLYSSLQKCRIARLFSQGFPQ